ncbi:MAG: glycine/D-amino acid oxidase-like deaminating enzyme [Parasphingorhabdus sp.]|jgi:glycine/D-amino acid oxidase-like deaminating enzyme
MTSHSPSITDDFKRTPYWWDKTPLPASSRVRPPSTTDVLIVGAGLSGLMVGLHLARAGVDVTIVDAGVAGEFASTRNFGAIGRTIRLSFSELAKKYNLEFATRVYSEAKDWTNYTANFIQRENIACRFERAGRVVAAHSLAAYDASARELEIMQQNLDVDTHMLDRNQQRHELGSDVYHGCAVYGDVGHLDPSMYHGSVYRLAIAAGVNIYDKTTVRDIQKLHDTAGSKYRVVLNNGEILADRVVVATNAETPNNSAIFKYFHRRTLPLGVYSAVSAPLEPEIMQRVFPKGRTVLETRRLYTGIRPIVGENRLLVVGQHLKHFKNEESAADALRLDMSARYPQLSSMQFSHVWHGKFCITFDWLPHMGSHEGVYYLHGLNGAGIPACGYLGYKLAMKILGQSGSETVFSERDYPKRFGYTGNAWFMPIIGNWYRGLDRREAKMAR